MLDSDSRLGNFGAAEGDFRRTGEGIYEEYVLIISWDTYRLVL